MTVEAKRSDIPEDSEPFVPQKMSPSFALIGLIWKRRQSLNLHFPIDYEY